MKNEEKIKTKQKKTNHVANTRKEAVRFLKSELFKRSLFA